MSQAFTRHTPNNPDLLWGLDELTMQERALQFFKYFENKICVYSPSVSQLYCNYTFFLPENQKKNIVVLPDPYAFQDTFNHIPEQAVHATNLYIVHGRFIEKQGLYLMMQKKDHSWSGPLSFKTGIEQLLKHFQNDDPFLPVLIKGDLRELNTRVPILHLHRLKLSSIGELSVMQKQNIRNVILNKLMGIYRDALKHRLTNNYKPVTNL